MAEFSVWGGVSLIVLLILLAIISSTALLFGAISAVQEQHVAGHSFVAVVVLALILAAVNFFSVQRAGLGMAAIAREKPEAVQAGYGKLFSFIILMWAVCAGFLGFWMVHLVSSFL